jgi:hypothetical protein
MADDILDILEEEEKKTADASGKGGDDTQGAGDESQDQGTGEQATGEEDQSAGDEAGTTEAKEEGEAKSDEPSLGDKLKELSAKLETAEKDLGEAKRRADGTYHDLTAERAKRQQIEYTYNEMIEKVSKIRGERAEAEKDKKPEEKQPKRIMVPVEFDEDGTPRGYVDEEVIDRIVQERLKPIQASQAETRQKTEVEETRTEVIRRVEGIFTEASQEAAPVLREAHTNFIKQWVELGQAVTQYVVSVPNPPRPPKTYVERVETLMSLPVIKDFKAKYPDTDVELLIETFTAETPAQHERKMRRLLSGVPRETKQESDDPPKKQVLPDTLKILAKKPRNLTGVPGREKGKGLTLDELAKDPDEMIDAMLRMTDDEWKKIERPRAG